MSSTFPEMMNSGRATERDGELTFTYLDSRSRPVTDTRPVLDADGIADLVTARLQTFHASPPGARESEALRRDRKYVAAHPLPVLHEAWNQLDDDHRMEMDMMLSHSSHHGLSDPDEVEEYADPQPAIPFAGDGTAPPKTFADAAKRVLETGENYAREERA